MRDHRTVRVVIAENHDLMRRGLKTMLESESDIEVVGEASDWALATSEVERTQPDVVLIDSIMPEEGGIEVIPEIKDASPNVGIRRPLDGRDRSVDLFTDRARRTVVRAQEEARLLNHNYIGPEHLLLGLIHEGGGVAAKALGSLGISLEKVRQQVEEIIGAGQSPLSSHIPFTPRAKSVLELSHREAFGIGHNYIGTEYILLGLIREGEGVAAQVLVRLGADLGRVRGRVIRLLSGFWEPTESYDWVSLLRGLRDAFPRVGIVALLSDDSRPHLASSALEADATVYVSKGDSLEKVVLAVRVAATSEQT